MDTSKQTIGKAGEIEAANFYTSQHYTILENNWHFGHLEIDLIVENENNIVFCEVKTRSKTTLGEPETFVTKQKQQNVIRAANCYVQRKQIKKDVRFDIISIVKNGENSTIKHIPHAFTPKW
ncbi:MAG: YraN family protein [Bacteroidales bacterium]|nr:YraN family protein [Bacteroidales bacterium]